MYNKMRASVEKYEGFYMGRYEASNDENANAQSKKDKEPWGQIPWSSSNDMSVLTGGAVEKARALYAESVATTGKAVSILPFGVQWDETVRFIKKDYPGIEKDSAGYGNYDTGSAIRTGNDKKYVLNNIYDMAGNLQEWTMEAHDDCTRVVRGGYYHNTGIYRPVSYRFNYDLGNSNNSIGFRVALYVSL